MYILFLHIITYECTYVPICLRIYIFMCISVYIRTSYVLSSYGVLLCISHYNIDAASG